MCIEKCIITLKRLACNQVESEKKIGKGQKKKKTKNETPGI